jgi:hypothetical protein
MSEDISYVFIPNVMPQNMCISGNLLYCTDFWNNCVRLCNKDTGEVINNEFITGLDHPRGITLYNDQLYISQYDNISTYDLTNGSLINSAFITDLSRPRTIIIYNNYVYVNDATTASVYRYNINGQNRSTLITGLTGMGDMTLYNNCLYICAGNKIVLYNLNSQQLNRTFITGLPHGTFGIISYSEYLLVSLFDEPSSTTGIALFNAKTGFLRNISFVPGLRYPTGIVHDDVYLYVGDQNRVIYSGPDFISYADQIVRALLPEPPCFKEDTKILTNIGYKLVQNLRKGDFVKTALNGFVPVYNVGCRSFEHKIYETRVRNQLYKCSSDQFPDVFEDLVLTGCHSILVDDFVSEEERQKTIEVNGDTYVTDKKYRLPACVDERTIVYEKEGTYNIYHFALENEDYYMNYGVYANGLLVETCSKRYLTELSNMEFLE